ncbi:MAG TPA: SDR family NAD(P)-dependent oxidoreductase [Polyangiaceae bacterium]|nr:SDR family NAD(P)-dependent oxidoreductase [Polyangiaceae bacterium]
MAEQRPLAVVTGANGAIGFAIARGLEDRGFDLVLVVRDGARAERSLGVWRNSHLRVSVETCDLGRQSEIAALAQRLPRVIDVLVNNAAECPHHRHETPEGIERQWATNVLGYHWMTQACTPALSRAKQARIVNVASYWAGGLELDDVEFRRRPYDNDAAYRQAKQADRMLTVGHALRLREFGIALYSCHPGEVRSKLSTDLGFGGHESPEAGADTPVWLATTPLPPEASGKYFAHRRAEPCRFGSNEAEVEALMQLCASYGTTTG